MNDRTRDQLLAVYARDLEREKPEERWLIEDLWARQAVGVLGGAAKSFKSYLGLDLALSVASRTPALDRFRVEDPGTALVYLAEDSLPQVRARLEALCRHRALALDELDLAVITEATLRLDSDWDQQRLRATLARFKPRLLLLDPLVRLHSGDENSSQEISRLLGYFRELQRSFGLAVILVHHASKRACARPGQALRGSSDLWAFGDSNAYLARNGERVVLTLEHRAAPPPEALTLELVSSASNLDTHLELVPEQHGEQAPALEELVLELLTRSGTPLPRTEIRARLRVNNQRLGDVLCALEKDERIRRVPRRGWALADLHGPNHLPDTGELL